MKVIPIKAQAGLVGFESPAAECGTTYEEVMMAAT